MEEIKVYIETFSSITSILILIGIFFKYYQYKKKLEVLKELNSLKEQNNLNDQDIEFIEENYKEYKELMKKDEKRLKLAYPILILIAGILFAFVPFSETMIYINVLVVSYIYLQIVRIHNRNFATFLEELKE